MIVLAPAVILAAWGWSYARALLATLESPGVPIELKFATRTGETAKFVASSYSLDFSRGFVRIIQPRFESPRGEAVASMGLLEISGLKALYGTDQVVRARGTGLKGRLVRLESGRFEFEDWLPEERDEETRIPFEVHLTDISVDLIDRAGNGWREQMSSSGLTVAGIGKDWVAYGAGSISNMGEVEARIQYLEGEGIQVVASTPRLELARLVNHLTTTNDARGVPDIRTASVGTLAVRGPFRLFLPAKAALRIESSAIVQATNVRYQQYAFDSGTFQGLITEQGAIGRAEARAGANVAVVNGSMRWDKTQRFAGYVSASSPSVFALPQWAIAHVPRGASYSDASYTGWAAYYPDTGLRLSGDVTAHRLVMNGETLSRARADLRYARGRAVVRLESGFFRGERASGIVAYEPGSGRLLGGIDSVRVDLASVGRQLGIKGLTGTALISATLGGTTTAPRASFNVSGSGVYQYQDWRIPMTSFQASGVYDNGALRLDRAFVDSPAGLLVASGSMGRRGDLGVDVTLRSLRPRLIDSRVSGSANVQARVTGTLENPLVTGRVEGYALTYQNELLPAVRALFTADRRQVRFRDLLAVRGSAVIEGSGRYVLADRGIEADLRAKGIQIADLLGPEFVGAVEVPSLELSGTIDKPVLTAFVRGSNLLARGVKITTLNARAETVNGQFRLRDTFAQFANGTVTAGGTYDPQTKSGTLTLTATNLELEELMPEFAPFVSAEGVVSGEATLTLANGELRRATGQGRLKDIVVNGTTVGSGLWTMGMEGSTITGTLEIGQLDRFLTLQDFRFNPESKAIGGKLDVFNLRLEDLVAISRRYLPQGLDYDLVQAISSITGQVSLASTIGGTIADPDVEVPTLAVSNLKYKETEFEALTADFSLQNAVWTVRNFELLGDPTPAQGVGRRGQARYAFSGVVEEHGGTNVAGGFTNLSLQEFSAFVPWFTGKSGEADVYFSVSGPTSNPRMRASVDAKGMLAELDRQLMADVAAASASGSAPEDQVRQFYDKTLRVNLYDIEATGGPQGAIEISGNYFWRGFQGVITAKAPFDFPFVVPPDREASGRITLAERDLKEIARLVNGLDDPGSVERTNGKVRGELRASGTPSNLSLDGEVLVNAETFAIDGIEDVVKNMKARLALEPKRIVASLDGESSRGGSVKALVETPVADLENFANAVQSGVLMTLLDNPVAGHATIENLRVSHVLEGGTALSGTLAANVKLDGTIASPEVSGSGSISDALLSLGGFAMAETERQVPVINPKFDLTIAMKNPARVRNALADLYLLGDGSLSGSLQYPQLRADLQVDRGNVNLPGSRIRIEQGGTVDISYVASPLDVVSSAQVELEGRTAVTAPRFGDILERYDVYLGIRGDLLKEGGLQLTASSDPPELSQDRILALLGQAELISGIGSSIGQGGLAGGTERRLRNALIGFSLPVLLDPVTSGIAQSLSLDYLSIEYNAYEQASLVFSKPLGGGFSLQGRRQITAPPPGFPQQYDIRLVYRPRRLPGILNRFSFSFGADELRPWKIAVEYGTRFSWK